MISTTLDRQAIANQKENIGFQLNKAGYHCCESSVRNQWLVWKFGASKHRSRCFRLIWSDAKGWLFAAEDHRQDEEAIALRAIVQLSILVAVRQK